MTNSEARSGFRLARLEVYNWGTFHKQVFTLKCDGYASVLAGENGGGKSTLVDALVTLLVPHTGRKYNSSSKENRRSDRNEASYVKGAYTNTYDEVLQEGGSEYLRGVGDYSVLLAVFQNYQINQSVSIAQVLRVRSSDIDKKFFVANKALSITEYFMDVSSKNWTAKLKSRGVDECRSFEDYRSQFKRFGVRKRQAVEAFNRAVSVKEIRSLDEFMRDVMLDEYKPDEDIRTLREQYEHLMASYEAIDRAEGQIKLLTPLMGWSTSFREATEDLEGLDRALELVPRFLAYYAQDALQSQLEVEHQQLALQQAELEALEAELADKGETLRHCKNAREANKTGHKIELINGQRETEKSRKQTALRLAQTYDSAAQALELALYSTREAFEANRRSAALMDAELPQRFDEVNNTLVDLGMTKRALETEQKESAEQLHYYRTAQSRIPQKYMRRRDDLLEVLGLSQRDIPFLGEVVQVYEDEQDWEPALQRLVGGKALTLLVPDRYMMAVSRYLNNTHIGIRLTCERMLETRTVPPRQQAQQQVIYAYEKMEVKPDTPYKAWVYDYLRKKFDHVCCEAVDDLDEVDRGITQAGLIRESNTRYLKDDTNSLNDRSHYLLGWDSMDQVAALSERLDQIKEEIALIADQQAECDQVRQGLENGRSLLAKILDIQSFDEIDWRSHEARILELDRQEQALSTRNDIKKLDAELRKAEDRYKAAEDKRKEAFGIVVLAKNTIQQYEDRLKVAQERLIDCQINWLDMEDKSIRLLNSVVLTHDELLKFESVESRFAYSINANRGILADRKQDLEEKILNRISDFRRSYEKESVDILVSIGSLPELERLHERLLNESLPQYKERFHYFLNESIVTTLSSFHHKLEDRILEVKRRIGELNESLASIDYSPGTYLLIKPDEQSKSVEIREFRRQLREVLVQKDETQRLFEFVKTLIDRSADRDWMARVLDTRKWQTFVALEIRREDGGVAQSYVDTAGKSGGQTVKLAYTILAAALVYQYDIRNDYSGLLGDSFRFVVIDEAFDKLDEHFIRYTMELYDRLGLQLMVVTLPHHVHKVEHDVQSFHVVGKINEHLSSVASLNVVGYQNIKRQLAAVKN